MSVARCAFFGAIFISSLSGWASTAPVSVERTVFAMGTSLQMKIEAHDRNEALHASEAAFQAVNLAEARLSTWKANSELSQINALPVGHARVASPELSAELKEALTCARETDFSFNPWMGPLVKAWGLRSGGRIPSDDEIARARTAVSNDAFLISDHSVQKNRDGALFEEGGFGKGIGLDDAAAALRKSGVTNASLNFGGQVLSFGKPSTTVAVADPADRAATLLEFELRNGSSATSGNSEHGVSVHGRRIGHLLNPMTGKPARYEGSITVVADNGMRADCHTKIFTQGLHAGMNLANREHLQVLWIEPGKRSGSWIAYRSCAWKSPLLKLKKNIEVRKLCPTQENTL